MRREPRSGNERRPRSQAVFDLPRATARSAQRGFHRRGRIPSRSRRRSDASSAAASRVHASRYATGRRIIARQCKQFAAISFAEKPSRMMCPTESDTSENARNFSQLFNESEYIKISYPSTVWTRRLAFGHHHLRVAPARRSRVQDRW